MLEDGFSSYHLISDPAPPATVSSVQSTFCPTLGSYAMYMSLKTMLVASGGAGWPALVLPA